MFCVSNQIDLISNLKYYTYIDSKNKLNYLCNRKYLAV